MLRPLLKHVANAVATLVVLPAVLGYRLGAALAGRERALPGWSQLLAQLPGLTGDLLRRAFYRLTLLRCEPTTTVGYGTIFSHPDVLLGRCVDIGAYCVLGSVAIEDDCLIASRVSILNGLEQHGTERLDLPIREQPGRFLPITIGRDTWIGEGAIVAASIGRHCVVGAGAVVTRPLPDFAVAVGVPARIIRFREEVEPDDRAEPEGDAGRDDHDDRAATIIALPNRT